MIFTIAKKIIKERLVTIEDTIRQIRSQSEHEIVNNICKIYQTQIKTDLHNVGEANTVKDLYMLHTSDIESELHFLRNPFLIQDMERDPFFMALQVFFMQQSVLLFFYVSAYVEYTSSLVYGDRIKYIGLPSIFREKPILLPLVLHEIGHYYFECNESILKGFDKHINSKLENYRRNAICTPNVDQPNSRLLKQAEIYESNTNRWRKEFFSDLFATHICGKSFLNTFLIFQVDKAYLDPYENKPTNDFRFKTIVQYLSRIGDINYDSFHTKYSSVIQTDALLDSFMRPMINETSINLLIDDFEKWSESNKEISDLKKSLEPYISGIEYQ